MKFTTFMKNMKKGKVITIVFAIAALLISMLQGYFYYSPEDYPIPFFRWLMIINNGILAFAFKPEIKIGDVAEWIQVNQGGLELFVSYAYVIALFVAPYCTIVFAYKMLERFIRFNSWDNWFDRNKVKCFIFGYNDEVKAMIKNYDKNAYRIHLVANDIDEDSRVELLKNNVIIHQESTFHMDLVASKKAKYVLLFDESAAKNFSRYQKFFDQSLCSNYEPDLKFYCRCEDFGIQSIIEDFQDQHRNTYDLELVNPAEIQIRELLEACPLHSYYNPQNTKTSIFESKNWDLHLLIVGFGKLGQQMLLQTMNMGVVNSDNDIIIDVVDHNIDEKRRIFENYFGESYVTRTEDEIYISSDHADGVFRIRFHKVDVRFQEFAKVLEENGTYTYAAICVKNMDVALHCLSQIRFYLKKKQNKETIPISIQIEHDKQMKEFLSLNDIQIIEDIESILTLEKLLHEGLNDKAKKFDQTYRGLRMEEEGAEKEESVEKPINPWNELEVFKRKSSYATAYHQSIKKLFMDGIDLEKYIGENGTVLRYKNGEWNYTSLIEVTKHIKDNKDTEADIYEFVKMEHRRWCYFVASCGFDYSYKKNVLLKEHDCLLNWDDLVERDLDETKFPVCPYDLMPLLMEYKDSFVK